MTHFQADVIDWELGVLTVIALVRFVMGLARHG